MRRADPLDLTLPPTVLAPSPGGCRSRMRAELGMEPRVDGLDVGVCGPSSGAPHGGSSVRCQRSGSDGSLAGPIGHTRRPLPLRPAGARAGGAPANRSSPWATTGSWFPSIDANVHCAVMESFVPSGRSVSAGEGATPPRGLRSGTFAASSWKCPVERRPSTAPR